MSSPASRSSTTRSRLRTNRWWRLAPWLSRRLDGFLLHRLLRRLGITHYVLLAVGPGTAVAGRACASTGSSMTASTPASCPEAPEDVRRAPSTPSRPRRGWSSAPRRPCSTGCSRCTRSPICSTTRRPPSCMPRQPAAGTALPSVLAGSPAPDHRLRSAHFDWRVDCETLDRGATALPDYTFCLAGRVNADQEARSVRAAVPPERRASRVRSHRARSGLQRAFDVGIIPFLPGYGRRRASTRSRCTCTCSTGNPGRLAPGSTSVAWRSRTCGRPALPTEFVDGPAEAAAETPDQHAREARFVFARAEHLGPQARAGGRRCSATRGAAPLESYCGRLSSCSEPSRTIARASAAGRRRRAARRRAWRRMRHHPDDLAVPLEPGRVHRHRRRAAPPRRRPGPPRQGLGGAAARRGVARPSRRRLAWSHGDHPRRRRSRVVPPSTGCASCG